MDNRYEPTLEQDAYKKSNKRFRHAFPNYFEGITELPIAPGLAFNDYAALPYNNS